MKKNKYILEKLKGILFYISILLLFISFNFQDSKTGGWVRQFFPISISSKTIKDITFTDSITGYAITNKQTFDDTTYIIKTSNAGFNWVIIREVVPPPYNALDKMFFLNNNTGFIASYIGIPGNISNLQKTTNGGLNWQNIYWPTTAEPSDLFVLNSDTIWMCSPSGLSGGLYRTTNGGVNWTIQYIPGVGGANGYSQSIYFYNRNIGFLGTDEGELLKTINCGENWVKIPAAVGFSDIHFVDSLTGFIASSGIYKTTNGGLNWQQQNLPNVIGGITTNKSINRFSYCNDTIYGVYSFVWYGGTKYSAVIYKSTNGGLNWGYQIPDTSFNVQRLYYVNFINGKKGWAYSSVNGVGGIYTTVGGDTTILSDVSNINTKVPNKFKLFQNYPNPFNSNSKIKIENLKLGKLKLVVYDVTGKEVVILMNKILQPGIYEVIFKGNYLASGVYFYSLFVDEVRIDTKKLILSK